MTAPAPAAPPVRRRRRGQWLLAPLLAYAVAVAGGMSPSVPFDVVINLAPVDVDERLRVPADGKRRLVVLQHGLWRSPWALWRLERALRAHGYEVLNPGYPSTKANVEDHADRLAAALETARRQAAPVDELYFVAHSMGGLVVHDYLRRGLGPEPTATVFVAVPHRGAVLADLRKRWWPFQLFMGQKAALQLSPGCALHLRPLAAAGPAGCVIGSCGAGNPSIPGPDDGTVGVDEARWDGAVDEVQLELGHTAIAASSLTLRQVLHFLRHRQFWR